jgi:hydrogenase-4 component B
MNIMLIALAIMLCGGLLSLISTRSPRWATGLGAGSVVAGCLLGLWPAFHGLLGGGIESFRMPWAVPGGEFYIRLDALSAFFLIPIFGLSALAAVYGGNYLLAYRDRKMLGASWFFFNLFVAAMALVVLARQAVLFMVAWEVMSVAAFFLVTFEHEKKDVRVAGWIYLVASHMGAAFLLAMFLYLGRASGSLDFDTFVVPGAMAGRVILLLALVGFGTKAGMVPLHIWLPEAHPAAPSHVSALMSGVMIKLGLYGLFRVMMFLGAPAVWWGPMFVTIGFVGAVLGISFALFQRDLKRALAYSSIENMGLILLALGVGLWGLTSQHPVVAALGLSGAFLHIWNHSLMKSLMFLGAGSVMHGAGGRDMERLGGLMKRMPRTGAAMVLGAVAIAALPPLNGFVSEWLIYLALLHGGMEFSGGGSVIMLLGVGLLALVGAMALLCFVRLVGIVLLGEPRSEEARHAHESSRWMTAPLAVLAGLCILAALFPGVLVKAFEGVIGEVFGLSEGPFEAALSASSALTVLGGVNSVIWGLIGLVALFFIFARRRGGVAADTTWSCGYMAPAASMQYTGQSFSEMMVTRLFLKSFRPKTHVVAPREVFPVAGKMTTSYPDTLSRVVYQPLFNWLAGRFARLRWLQQGKIQVYMMYFVVVLLLAFAWQVVRSWLNYE